MEVRAIHKYARISAKKARDVAREIQGMPVSDALDTLTYTPKKAALLIGKTLKSAVANAENNHEMVAETMVVKEAHVTEGPTSRRFKPRARGSAAAIRKRTSHIYITLEEAPEEEEKPKAKKTAKKAAPKKAAPKKEEKAAEEAPAATEVDTTNLLEQFTILLPRMRTTSRRFPVSDLLSKKNFTALGFTLSNKSSIGRLRTSPLSTSCFLSKDASSAITGRTKPRLFNLKTEVRRRAFLKH